MAKEEDVLRQARELWMDRLKGFDVGSLHQRKKSPSNSSRDSENGRGF
jgi:hypothetical protein